MFSRSTRRSRRASRAAALALRTIASFGVLALGACGFEREHRSPGEPRSGEQVYLQVCAACHSTGVEKSPQFGDRAAWKPLIEEGQHVLTAHAWVGVRGMPARGGDPGLSLDEFARAAAYLARAAGGDWRDPDAKMLARIRDEVRDRLEALRAAKDDDHGHEHDDDDEEDDD